MTCYTTLLNHDSDRPMTPGYSPDLRLVEANYQLPILWLAMFEESDLSFMEYKCNTADGEELVLTAPTLFASTSKAKAVYAKRLDMLQSTLGPECLQYFSEWQYFLDNILTKPFVQIDMEELCDTMGSDDFEQELKSWQRGVISPGSSDWQALCEQACFDDTEDVRRLGIRGFSDLPDLNWD